jgi:hypothetical protein
VYIESFVSYTLTSNHIPYISSQGCGHIFHRPISDKPTKSSYIKRRARAESCCTIGQYSLLAVSHIPVIGRSKMNEMLPDMTQNRMLVHVCVVKVKTKFNKNFILINYLCLFAESGCQVMPTHIVLCFCFVFLPLVYPMLPVSLDCPYLIALSVFSNVYMQNIISSTTCRNIVYYINPHVMHMDIIFV